MKYSEVFVPGGFPYYTYNPRLDRELERQLAEITENLCKLAVVTGYTKLGKTVLVKNSYPQDKAIWVDGGVIRDEEDFWSVIIERLNLFHGTSEANTHGDSSDLEAEISGGVSVVVAKSAGKLVTKMGESSSLTETRTRAVSSRITALKGLRTAKFPLIIDDFHYIERELQGSLVRALKALIFEGLPVILIAIPHRRYDALRVEREMTGRLYSINIPLWEEEELRYIPEKGFPLLKCNISVDAMNSFAHEAIGSPHLVQDFCRTLCRQKGITTENEGGDLAPSKVDLKEVFYEVANAIGRPIFEKLARGPRQRTDRILRKLKNGKEVDIYKLVLHALAHMHPGLVAIEYEELRVAIREISFDTPQLHEIARVLRNMANIATSDESSIPVIDFEEEEKVLYITDPFFAFFLRWGELDSR